MSTRSQPHPESIRTIAKRSPASDSRADAEEAELAELMKGYVRGDTDCFSRLCAILYPVIYRFHMANVKRNDESEDLTQRTFLKLHMARRRYRLDAPVKPWIFSIAKNVQRDLFRKQRRSREQALESTDPRWEQQASDVLSRRDLLMRRKLYKAVQSLPAGQRDVILLHKYGDLSMEEVATKMSIGVSAAKVRAHRGYAELRASLRNERSCFLGA